MNLRYYLRALRKSPAFTITAIVTLALGIAGNSAMFSVIHAVLLKPLAYRNPDRLVYFSKDDPPRNVFDAQFGLIQFDEMKAAARSFTALGAYGANAENTSLSRDEKPEALKGARVSANFLDILGVQPLLGRSFLPEEDTNSGPSVAMISAELWKRRFAADPSVIGKTAALDSTAYTIIGVLPPRFEFPFAGVDVWFTKPSHWSALPPRYWNVPLLKGFGRLKPGVTLQQARAEIEMLDRNYIRAHPSPHPGVMRLVWLKDRLVQNVRTLLWTLFGAVGFVLLIACANVAGLLLARAKSRSREFAVRAALGAGRGRLIRQLLAESLVLAVLGGALGALLARWGLSALANISTLQNPTRPGGLFLPGAHDIQLNGVVFGFTVALSIATGVLFGLFPSLKISRPDVAAELRESGAMAGRVSSGRRGIFRLSARDLLVIGQVALSIVLLIGAALLMRSFAALQNVNPGFQPANLLTMKIALPTARYDTDPKKAAFFGDLVQRVQALPGVRGAAMTMSLPTTTWIRTNINRIEGQPAPDENDPLFAVIQSITPGYFRTLGIPLIRGREFTARDNTPGAPPAVIVNENLARRIWPNYPSGVNPVGLHLGEGYDKAVGWLQVAGIAANIHEGGLASDTTPEFYVPCIVHPPQTAYLVLRTHGNPLSFAESVRQQVLAIDPDQPVSDIKTMQSVLDATLGQRRLTMWLLGTFAAVALLLAVIGIYGVIAYSVAQRTQEVGIRRALGAQQSDILRLVVAQGFALSLGGVALGIAGAFALTRVMKNLLFHVSATDPATFAGIAVLFLLVALAASYIPARRAARIDPMAALRAE